MEEEMQKTQAIDKTVVDNTLQEVKKHGREGFPVAVYEDNFAYFEQGYICWHWHEELQFSVVKHEKIEFSVAGKAFVLQPGDAVFINSQALHQIRPCDPLHGAIYSYIFKASFLEHDVLSEVYQEYIQPILKNRELCIVFMKDQDRKCLDLLTEIRTVYEKKQFGYQLRIKSLFGELWWRMAEKNQAQPGIHSPREERDIRRVKEAIAYIDRNYGEKLTLEELSEYVHVSKSELCRCFRRVLHTTPVEYLIQYRVQKAAGMLSDTEETVTQIAVMTGFDSAGHMGRFFRKYMGSSPGAFRKRGEKQHNSLI